MHYADTFNTAKGMKQLACSSAGGGAERARAYYPSAEGLRVYDGHFHLGTAGTFDTWLDTCQVYDLLSGVQSERLKAHFGDVTCCTASPLDGRVFSGGADHVVHAWTPPPCGLSHPAPKEKPVTRTVAAAAAAAAGPAAEVDGDDWSDGEDEGDGLRALVDVVRRARKRARS